MTENHLIELIDVTKTYSLGSNPVVALDHHDLEVSRGEFLAITGKSGCGKSALINILGGLDTPDQGRVLIDGEDLTQMDDRRLTLFRRGQIGIVFQFFNLLPILNLEENILLPHLLNGGSDRQITAAGDDFAFQLELKPTKPPVMHGINGYSLKGSTPERASCYYSFSRLETAGLITIAGKSIPVKGESWMDHEFSTAPLEPGTVGWDWFSLQMTDKSEIMIFLLRKMDGGLNPASSGSYIDFLGVPRHLDRSYFEVKALSTWKSKTSGAVYPAAWQIRIPLLGIDVTVTANLPDQEMRTSASTGVIYWEGSVSVKGTKSGGAIEGHGYVELTGNAGPFNALK